ncbi:MULTISPECIES: hypothetical protein [unclassified Streptomyces]|uniref:hypothetical protein n=1 Tax=unclassified Streptomyces TaxID=2593676 RepID=UPI002253293D|nr:MULTISPECIES: hypothetical protein [unclassified Streptomyces]MCX5438111.1 hypothetical protein [Streptomyces sp. NBC_00063]WUB95329.1 hypothetical protein OHO83_25150 [Streptomyces sp. NBC_00569]
MPTRMFAVSAAVVGAAVLATGITYAAQSESDQAAPEAKQAAPAAEHAAPPAKRAAPPVKKAAPPVKKAAPEAAPAGTDSTAGRGDEGRDHGGRGHEDGDRGYGGRKEGRIHFNERTFSAHEDGCVPAASGLGSTSFSIDNDSDATVEVYRGFNCDNGAPVATVGPYGATYGVAPQTDHGSGWGGFFLEDGVVGSFRVIRDHGEW